MKVLVTYYTVTGNTEKVARDIYAEIAEEKKLLPVDQVESVSEYDLIFVGFPVMRHAVPPQAANFLKSIPENRLVAFFSTHGSLRGGRLAIEGFYHALTLAQKLEVLGSFGCQGTVKAEILDALMEKPESRGWVMEAQCSAGHPDDADLADARFFAATMVTQAYKRLKTLNG